MAESKIALFRGKEIRRVICNNEWWFSIVDVIEVLTGTDRPRKYWNDLKKKLVEQGYNELSEKIGQLNVAVLFWKGEAIRGMRGIKAP